MDDHAINSYLQEAKTQSELAINAINQLNHSLPLAGNPKADQELQQYHHREVFRSIHSLLTHSSNLSKIFWPPVRKGKIGRDRSERGSLLRERTGLPDEGHFLQDRKIRDHLEHFDERLDDWRENSERHNMVQDMIGPVSAIGGIEPKDMMRGYDPGTRSFTFRGESYNIQNLADSIIDLRAKIVEAAQRPIY